MTKDIEEMLEWNAWANEKYRNHLEENVDFEDCQIETPYGNLLDRIVHIFASFKMWYQRMNGESPQEVISGSDFDNWDDLNETWREYEEIVLDYAKELSDDELNEKVSYVSFDGATYTRRRRHILMHLTAHPNYHRGQISAIFKERGMPSFPSTDMVIYYLETGQADRSE